MAHHVSVHDHIKQKKAHKQKKKLILYSSFFISIFAGVLYFVFFSGYCDIRGIDVVGAEKIQESEVRAVVADMFNGSSLFVFSNKNFFLFSSSKAADAVKKRFPVINSVEVDRRIWGAKVAVDIVEREAVGIVCGKNEQDACMYFDAGGMVFSEAPRIIGASVLRIEEDAFSIPAVFPAQKYSADTMNFILNAKRHTQEKAGITIETFRFLNEYGDVEARTQEGFAIFFNMNQDAELQAQFLKNVLVQEVKEQAPNLEYINLRVENRVYYKLK